MDQEITEVVKTTTTKIVRHRPAKKQLTRQEFLDQLPQVEEVVSLKTTTCPDCQHEMGHIGKRLARREARLKEPELYCANLYEESYKCKYCGNPLVQTKGKKKKEFCSDKCRKQYWKQKNFCKRECLICHKIFTPSYSDEQKYCSKACYLKRSVNGGGSDES